MLISDKQVKNETHPSKNYDWWDEEIITVIQFEPKQSFKAFNVLILN